MRAQRLVIHELVVQNGPSGFRRVVAQSGARRDALAQRGGARLKIKYDAAYAEFLRQSTRLVARFGAQEGRVEDRVKASTQHAPGRFAQALVRGSTGGARIQPGAQLRRCVREGRQMREALALDVGSNPDGTDGFEQFSRPGGFATA